MLCTGQGEHVHILFLIWQGKRSQGLSGKDTFYGVIHGLIVATINTSLHAVFHSALQMAINKFASIAIEEKGKLS